MTTIYRCPSDSLTLLPIFNKVREHLSTMVSVIDGRAVAPAKIPEKS